MNSTGVNVREVLELPILKDSRVLSGANGLDRLVRYIDIMEVPEIKPWLRQGEILLTTAYSIREDSSLLPKLVEDLASAGAAALVFKPERFIHQIPEEMIEASNRLKLPVIAVPVGIPSIDITHSVMELILDRQSALLRQAEGIYKKLTAMVLENRGIQAVADAVCGMLDSSVCVVDSVGEAIVVSPRGINLDFAHSLQWNIVVDKEIVGKFFLQKKGLSAMDQVCVDQARLVFALELMRRKTAEETEKRLKGDFIDELLSDIPPTKANTLKRGLQLGLNPNLLWQVAVFAEEAQISLNKKVRAELVSLFKSEGQKQGAHPHLEVRGGRGILFLPTRRGEGDSWSWKECLATWLQQRNNPQQMLILGIGKSYPLWEIAKSYQEAKKALFIGQRTFVSTQSLRYEEVEIYDIIMEISDRERLASLFRSKLESLLSYDNEHGTELLKTFFIYLEAGGSTQNTAERLYIHRNSVKYRLERIREIANIKFDSDKQRFEYLFCLVWYLTNKV